MIKLKDLIKESKYAFSRKFGEPLPTLKGVTEKHQSKKKAVTEKADFAGFDSQTLGQLKDKMRKASANYGNWHINANEFLWNVDTSTGDGKKLEKMIHNNRFRGRDSGKEIQDLMEDIYKQAIKSERDSR
jgi:hypothetical protein